jgi:hypothetical protein
MILSLRRHHDAELPLRMPHESLIETTGGMLGEAELAQSLAAGWTLARDVTVTSGVASPLTPMTRIAPPVRVFRNPRERTKDVANASGSEDVRRGQMPEGPPDRIATDVATPALTFAAPTDLRVARLQRRDGGVALPAKRKTRPCAARPSRATRGSGARRHRHACARRGDRAPGFSRCDQGRDGRRTRLVRERARGNGPLLAPSPKEPPRRPSAQRKP